MLIKKKTKQAKGGLDGGKSSAKGSPRPLVQNLAKNATYGRP